MHKHDRKLYKAAFICSLALVLNFAVTPSRAGETQPETYPTATVPPASPANYSEKTAWPQPRVPGAGAAATNPAAQDQYSRLQAQKTITMRNYTLTNPGENPAFPNTNVTGATASVTFRCAGQPIESGNWGTPTMSGNCWGSHTRCFPTRPNPTCVTTPQNKLDFGLGVPQNTTDNIGTPFEGIYDYAYGPYVTNCPGTTAQANRKVPDVVNPTSANATTLQSAACLFNYVAPLGITGNTNDDMFQIDASAGAFFEYKKLPLTDPTRLIYLGRNGGAVTNDLMMPSGPAPTNPADPNTGFGDYRQFVNSPPPSSVVTVEKACYPTSFSLCGAPKYPPVCGKASDGPASSCDAPAFNNNNYNLCYSGEPVSAVVRIPPGPGTANSKWSWTCRQGSASLDKACTGNIRDASCGSSHGDDKYFVPNPPTGGFCGCGEKNSGVSKSGQNWVWTCRNPNNVSTSSCHAKACYPRGYDLGRAEFPGELGRGEVICIRPTSDAPAIKPSSGTFVNEPRCCSGRAEFRNGVRGGECGGSCSWCDGGGTNYDKWHLVCT